jgi:tetratricopeptide (TPR) repeat protein
MKAKQVLLAGLLLATVVFTPSYLPSCGPSFPEAIFTETYHPPLPSNDYARGRLGVLQHTYARRYLFVAYRYLSGNPLSNPGQESFAGSSQRWDFQPSSGETPAAPPLDVWQKIRNEALGVRDSLRISVYRRVPGNQWQSFTNCTDESFQSAVRTLKARIEVYGLQHRGVKSWIEAQDLVFANCSGDAAVPSAAEDDLPQVFKQDRAYQIAAAHFYATRYDEAVKHFRAIAADSASPWSGIAPYLVARCLIRKATVPTEYGKYDVYLFKQAEAELKVLLADETRRDFHPMARKLETFLAFRLYPLDLVLTLSEKLQNPSGSGEFRQNLGGYEYLLDHVGYRTLYSPDATTTAGEMTDWIATFQKWGEGVEKTLAHALERWRATQSPAWLLAAISMVEPRHPESADLSAAAVKLPKESPAYATAQYHRIRLLLASGKNEEARAAIDTLLPVLRTSLDHSSLNLFLAWRLKLARSFEEFLEFAPRFPSMIQDSREWDFQTGKPKPAADYPLFGVDSVKVLNEGIPLSLLRRAAVSKSLPLHLRKQVVRAGWVRAILVADEAAARELSIELELKFPELKQGLKAWSSATDAEARQFAAAVLMLHFPGLNPFLHDGVPRRKYLTGIDNVRENWWCGLTVEGNLESRALFRPSYFSRPESQKPASRPAPTAVPGFVTEAEKDSLRIEWNKLAATEAAANYIGKIVLAWAGKHPQDARVPEALHLVVKATRFGCNDENSGRYSRDAFQLLHSKYENTQWAKMTPFWYR